MWLDRQAAIQAPGRNPHNMGSQEDRDRTGIETGQGQGQTGWSVIGLHEQVAP